MERTPTMAISQLPDLDRALQSAHELGASDVYLIPGEPVSFRVGGFVQRSDGEVVTADKTRELAVAAIGAEQLDRQVSETGRAHTAVSLPGLLSGQMYVSRAGGQYTIVIGVLLGQLPDAAAIKIPQAVLKLATESDRGLILFTGPTGSGKTTSAMATLDHINATQRRVVGTVEDPIATAAMVPKCSLLVQREVGIDVPDMVSGIVTSIWQDTDVLFVGEMRNAQEVAAVVSAAHVRCLVITQMHQSTALGAIRRLAEIPPPEGSPAFRRQLAEVLRCVVAQVLVPRQDGAGRVAIYGVLIPDDDNRRAIIEGRELVESTASLLAGGQSIEDHARQLAADGTIAADVAERVIASQKRIGAPGS
jgi:twitching motility protein PilT